MGSSLGVGFNPGSPDTMIPNLMKLAIFDENNNYSTITLVMLMGSIQVLLILGNKQLPRENRLRG